MTCSHAGSERWTLGLGGRRDTSSLCFETTASAVWQPVHSADPLTESDVVHSERDKRQSGCFCPLPSTLPSTCSKVFLQTCCRYSFELLSSLFFFSYSKKVTSKILIRTDNFILPFIFSHFPHLTKKKSRSPSPVPSASPFMQTENGNALLL